MNNWDKNKSVAFIILFSIYLNFLDTIPEKCVLRFTIKLLYKELEHHKAFSSLKEKEQITANKKNGFNRSDLLVKASCASSILTKCWIGQSIIIVIKFCQQIRKVIL